MSNADKKAEEHWEWLEKFLHDLGVDVDSNWGVIYKNAFTHGYKHGFKVADKSVRE